ncbi:MAG TPA: cupin domain-containing protein [Phycisphaerae bacterium]|jgi:mannose-6-phosphate isomerase-like protein (cupin superfamily)|nr:cupin domain-containing protein [Phycisphaerae bacterium]
MRQLTVADLKPNGVHLLPSLLGDARIAGGGVYVFKPGETAHPEPRHVHDVDEVFVFLQGSGVIPVDGVDYAVRAGDVVVVAAGEDHHTRSSADDPLVAAWYLMDRKALQNDRIDRDSS